MADKKESRRDNAEREQALRRRARSMDEDLFDGDNPTNLNESPPADDVTSGELTDVVEAIKGSEAGRTSEDEKLVPNINEMSDRGVNATPARRPAAQEEPADRSEIETNDVEMAHANRSADRTKGAVEEKGVGEKASSGGSVDENVPGEMSDEATIFMASAFMIEGEMPETPALPERHGSARAQSGQSRRERIQRRLQARSQAAKSGHKKSRR